VLRPPRRIEDVAQPVAERVQPEHDERDRDQEEVFIVLDGNPTMVIDGERHPAPAGTFVRLDTELRRTVVNEGDGPASVLIVSAPRSSGYQPMSWA
jgi:uncharacterized cupin superfamily protein